MFDFHMHSRVSFDGHDTGEALAKAAAAAGLKEICFTDHLDYDPRGIMKNIAFDTAAYSAEYDHLDIPGLIIRRGAEFGLARNNQEQFRLDMARRPFDFVLGSIHFVDDLDVYFQEYWDGKTIFEAERRYLEESLACIQVHDGFDVLAHLTYISKCHAHPAPRPVSFNDHREIIEAILENIVSKGIGMELNTSGVDRCGDYLPSIDMLRRFRELGGEIVTIGSDAHRCNRVGQYTFEACDILKDIFGYVCTFEKRQPIFHKL